MLVCMLVCLHLFVRASVCACVCLSACMSVCLSVCAGLCVCMFAFRVDRNLGLAPCALLYPNFNKKFVDKLELIQKEIC